MIEQDDGRRRVLIENVQPAVDGGEFPAKRVVGDRVTVTADIFADGHDVIAAVLLHRKAGAAWAESPMAALVNDRWEAAFTVTELGLYEFTVEAWIDRLGTWKRDLAKKAQAGQDVAVDLLVGAELAHAAARRASAASAPQDAQRLEEWARALGDTSLEAVARHGIAKDDELFALAGRYGDRTQKARWPLDMPLCVDPEVAEWGAWYEMFPRGASPDPGRPGTFRDVEAQLPRIASMGFDVLYFPPIHPIGRAHRKGRNNAVNADPGDPGSPWAIGAEEGGHTAIHPDLGTPEDFRRLVAAAKDRGIRVALDIAFQCAPDHPWVKQHPQWFRHRPDGSIQYAENPPKKYEDIVPFDFESEDWRGLWNALADVIRHWIGEGVRVFRVDNPHTKAVPFWAWLIPAIKRDHPEVVFLAEAFTRPRMLYRLAKIGFSQSYNYFPWRNTKYELETWFREIYRPPVVEFFRANLWPNTPDILTEYLQTGGRPAFVARFVLAATLGTSYGIYGPAYELMESTPREYGSEEYRDSEKYEVRHWQLARADSLEPLIARVNRIRRENPAIRRNRSLAFHPTDNEQLIAYSKTDAESGNTILVVVNLDPHHTHAGWLELDPATFGLDPARAFQVHDLLGGTRFLWQGKRHYVELDPHVAPAHVFRIRRYVRTERDFEYYL